MIFNLWSALTVLMLANAVRRRNHIVVIEYFNRVGICRRGFYMECINRVNACERSSQRESRYGVLQPC